MSSTAMAQTPKIEWRDVHKRFGSKVVLDGVNLAVAPAESLVIIGGSGTGKSVTLKCVLGILKPDSGDIFVDGENVVGQSAGARQKMLTKFGMLFQGGALFDSLPVWRNVAFGLIQGRGVSARTAKESAIENLRQVGLSPDVADLKPSELSGGMQKRVGLARAIAAKPEIIFFDEPTTGLDPIMADVINDLIREQVKNLGCTAVTITHDMSSVRKIADNVAMLHKGKIVWHGARADIDASGNEYVNQFVKGLKEGPIQMEVRRG
jgi:phospholipid/cholesterol/gamma-HCH transport system ATP-binding protein